MDDIYATFDFGYDPATSEDCPRAILPARREALPARATVNPAWLPPVGRQTTPSCFVWAAIYGLATFKAAKAGGYTPSVPYLQASPFYAYVKILEQHGAAPDSCTGGRISWCLDFLQANDGTPNLEQAPFPAPEPGDSSCGAAWAMYGDTSLVSDYAFNITGGSQFGIEDELGLDMLRRLIVEDRPLAYGTALYADFLAYGASPTSLESLQVPYLGNGIIQKMAGGRRAGHCMLVIGYDDELGAVLLQNSFGIEWGTEWNGSRGYVWMAYDTFQALAQGSAFLITDA